MKRTVFLGLLLPLSATSQPLTSAQIKLLEQTNATEVHLATCLAKYEERNVSTETLRRCLESEKKIERLTIYGRYLGLETPEVEGRYTLDRNYIENAPITNGDINELIALLPGVQVSESAVNVSGQQEIRAQEISISGGQAWQTGFFIDGMNYNSRLDPASSGRNNTGVNDVEGSVQTMNVNTDIVSGITVYDNNIPVEFGNFSGGVVDVDTRSAFDAVGNSEFSFGYRTTQSEWNNYHIIQGNRVETPEELGFATPDFVKSNYKLNASYQINHRHGLLLSATYLESEISELSLQQPQNQLRRNLNALLKYSYRNGWVDSIDWTLLYAPYEDSSFLIDTINSDYRVDGGSVGTTFNLAHDFAWMHLTSELSLSKSDNSREAPPHYYMWIQAKGKDWGKNSIANETAETQLSLEGGYGDLDKTQITAAWKNTIVVNDFNLLGVDHSLYFGSDFQFEKVQRDRNQESYYYNSPLQYSTALDGDQLNCSGYTLDCIALSYFIPLTQLETQLGSPLDFSNPAHVLAYSENVSTTPQYFQSRLVRPEEHIAVDLTRYALFAADSLDIGRVNAKFAVRIDYDDFFKNVNIAPRFSMGVDVFDNGSSLAIFGLNRYYDAGLVTYKVREQQLPSYTQYRPIRNGYLQNWLTSSGISDFRYRYNNVNTPYDDELVVGWKQATEHLGNFSIKFVKRKKYDQLARETLTVRDEDGFYYIQMSNLGYGDNERITFAWDAKFGMHSLWLNATYTDNYSNVDSYDSIPDQTALDQLVFFQGELISKTDLELINTNFSRPIIVGAGWSVDWLDTLTTSITANFNQGYTTAVANGSFVSTGELSQACPECEISSVLVPEYDEVEVDPRFLVNMKAHWRPELTERHNVSFTIDVLNLFDSRTQVVREGNSGIETGRQFWLGVNYDFN